MKQTTTFVPALFAALSVLLLPVAAARADFGDAGSTVINSELDLDLLRVRVEQPDGDRASINGLDLGLGGSHFVADHVSVGASLNFLRQWAEGSSTETTVAGGLVGGYEVRLGSRLHVWPQAGLGYSRTSVASDANLVTTRVVVSAYAPIVFEPAAHLLIGFVPMIGIDLKADRTRDDETEDDSKIRLLGTSAFLAGWF
jgi:hypothetical protein